MAKLIFFLAVQIIFLAAVSSAGDDGEDFARTIDTVKSSNQATGYKLYLLLRRSHYVRQRFDGNSSDKLHVVGPGRQGQGFYSGAAQKEFSFLVGMNFAFKTGKYNGSTITILGRNPVLSKVREMPIVGGSGLFRFARGYVEARTKLLNLKNGDAIVEYSCYVLHY
ncbi:hypothetical protein YC2023_093455 [Brassica napus]